MLALSHEPLPLQLRHPFGISYGTISEKANILVKVQFEGFEGWGEAAPACYHGETADTVRAVLSQWASAGILGDDPFALRSVSSALDQSIERNYAAKAAVNMALCDLSGKVAGRPVWQLLGLSCFSARQTSYTIGIDSLASVESKTEEALALGFKILKVKQGTDYDREIIRHVRKVAPDVPLIVDANGAWTTRQAVSMSEFLYDCGVELIEQPLPKNAPLEQFALVRRHSLLPIFADESVMRAHDVARMADVVDGIVIKIAKAGGLLEAIDAIAVARAHGLQVMIGCMIESSLGISAAAQLGSLADRLDLDGALLLADDPFTGLSYEDGAISLSFREGLGVHIRSSSTAARTSEWK